jgi:hypothetical protein
MAKSYERLYKFGNYFHIFPITSYGERSEAGIRVARTLRISKSHVRRNQGLQRRQ